MGHLGVYFVIDSGVSLCNDDTQNPTIKITYSEFYWQVTNKSAMIQIIDNLDQHCV